MTLSTRHRIRNSKWRSEAEHATSRSRRLPTILSFTRGWGRNIFVSLKPPWPGTEPRTLALKAAVLTTTLGPTPYLGRIWEAFQQTQNICMTFLQCWVNVKDVEPTLYKCYTNVWCLLGCYECRHYSQKKRVACFSQYSTPSSAPVLHPLDV